jgi:hypothetical protein
MAKMKVGKAKTSRGEESLPFNMPKTAGSVGPAKMGSMGMGMKKGGKVKPKEGSAAEERTESKAFEKKEDAGMKKGGGVKKYARGGGIESKGKTRGKFV